MEILSTQTTSENLSLSKPPLKSDLLDSDPSSVSNGRVTLGKLFNLFTFWACKTELITKSTL